MTAQCPIPPAARRAGRASGPLRVAVAAGEASGDLLGAGLIAALREQAPAAVFEGIAGPRMLAAGCAGLYPMERLSVMGLVEVAGRYAGLMRDRRRLVHGWLRDPPDVFVGIDAPDFNLGLERALRRHGVPTVHYVSPSVWAWRRYRIRGIRKAVDRMLTLFPFEADFYRQAEVAVTHVGHPLADQIPPHVDQAESRRRLGLAPTARIVALLPGSRMTEVRALASLLLDTAAWLTAQRPGFEFVMPAATGAIAEALRALVGVNGRMPAPRIVDGDAQSAMAASDVVVLASGTATLEAALLKRPMVVTYRMHPLTFRIMKAMMHVPYVSLPNLLAGRALVPECLQHEARPERLGTEVLRWLDDPTRTAAAVSAFESMHTALALGASKRAAAAVLEVAA